MFPFTINGLYQRFDLQAVAFDETLGNMKEEQTVVNELADFCSIRSVLLVIVTMLLLAIVVVMVPGQQLGVSWASLGMIAMFLQWLGLLSLAVLCMISPLLKRINMLSGAILTFVLIQLVTAGVSEVTYQITHYYAELANLRTEHHELFLFRNVLISMIISGVALRYMYLQRQLQLRIEAENQAQIQALQARIRPHFLFNSMNTIAALTHVDAALAEKAVLDLSQIYRASLKADDNMTTLADEIELTRHYLEVEKLRLHDRLTVDWQVDEAALGIQLPSLMIQPLVENAVYHGIEPLANGGTITILVQLQDRLHIVITNPLPSKDDITQQQGNRMALTNICQRLNIAYGKQASLNSTQDETEYRVTIDIPMVAK